MQRREERGAHGQSPDARGAFEGDRDRPRRGHPDLHRGARADLPRKDRQDAVPGAAGRQQGAPADSTDAARSTDACAAPSPSVAAGARACATPRASSPGAVFFAGALVFDAATEARSASIRSITGVSARGAPRAPAARGPRAFASSSSRSWARYSLVELGGSNSPCKPADQLLGERELLLLHLRRRDRLVDLGLALHVLGDVERLERERVALRPDQAELLLAGEHERADADDAGLAHRLEQQRVRPALRLGAGGHEVVGAVEVDRVDLVGARRSGRSRSRVTCRAARAPRAPRPRPGRTGPSRPPSRERARRARPRRRGRGTSASA